MDKHKTKLELLNDLGLLGALDDSEVTSEIYREVIKTRLKKTDPEVLIHTRLHDNATRRG